MHRHPSPAQDEVEPTPYLSIEQVTRRLHISKTTLWQLRRDGKIRAFHVGRRVLFKSDDVTALVEQDGAEPILQPA
ncbi:MAG: helix-turn-helix domain-containing protein [Bacteroidetes bacterium]|nr:helix-turn-helix domain-containing protein [Bacteroidota bacterium]